ncbi:MAG: sigma-70 family RNA polymerase sigma factor [Saprospiraceae bacterium]|nr:sigma-70 family RNA polymerase sigma factor [Saprospiraceae bacterium]MBK8451121.1 sigma-70 family RNA polymerase sigma factor [Saprospiraceae bacterium]MBK8483070.1 sigma-70 family RNA polymerase sigma factor [Saprospiraceae bacterium]MBK9220601.1 sigma-70 family RNA polymerase sigma factor [Saprospiraceae bacterium]MBK9722551.1 sigma-70 family RNA polymerase sigma factor [Saprospiraceae bacterium]
MQQKKRSHIELIAGCVDNDRKAQEQLYKLHFKAMFQMCLYYCKEEQDALEVLNTGFLRVFQKIQLYKNEGSLEGWIRKVIYHVIMSELKLKKLVNKTESIENQEIEQHDFTLEKIFKEDLLDMVRRLPPATAHAFLLFANEGYSHIEIAEKLNISVGTSKWHISNARELLKKQIANES